MIDEQVERIRAQVGDGGVICGLSGGVDSATAAALVHRAVGDQLTCVLVDHGLLRKNEAEQVVETFRDRGIKLIHVDAHGPLPRPPRRGRRAGGASARSSARSSSASSRRRPRSSRTCGFLVQGTLYSDVIESGGDGRSGAATIKSHHNVGGLPDDLDFELVEPLRMLFKDEVRAVGDRARPARPDRLAPAVPGPGPGDPDRRRRGHRGAPRHPPRGRRDPPGGGPRRRPLPRAVAVVLRAAGRPLGRRPGRRAHLRLPDRHPRGHLRRTR